VFIIFIFILFLVVFTFMFLVRRYFCFKVLIFKSLKPNFHENMAVSIVLIVIRRT